MRSIPGVYRISSNVDNAMQYYGKAKAYDCFDNDLAGRIYGIRMMMLLEGREFAAIPAGKQYNFTIDNKLEFSIPNDKVSMEEFRRHVETRYSVATMKAPPGFKDWNDVTLGKRIDGKVEETNGLARHNDDLYNMRMEMHRKMADTLDKCVEMINGFKDYYTSHNQVCYENPSPGNKAGGITTLEDKSLGCVQKGGSSPVEDVLLYGESVKAHGLSLMTGPGNDLVASTVLAAAGCHLILFTTGRGTPFGCVVPTMKVATNDALAKKKPNWIDWNAMSNPDVGAFAEKVIAVASGEKAKNEISGAQGIAIFKDGVTL